MHMHTHGNTQWVSHNITLVLSDNKNTIKIFLDFSLGYICVCLVLR